MIPDWQNFLKDNGAEFSEDRLVSFGNDERERRAALGGDVMCDLSRYRLLAFQGADVMDFLQGQVTSDIKQLTPEHSLPAGFCTPKGRLVSNFRLLQNGATVLAILPADMMKPTLAELQQYVVRADVQMGDATDALVHFGISGEKATGILAAQLGALPAADGDVLQHDRFMVIRIAEHRFEVFGNVEDSKSLWEHLDVHCTAVGDSSWEMLNIRDGLPEITPATSGSFVPQMINLDRIGGISFDKGCYTGQEIVARTHYLGKQKRRMYHIGIQSDAEPQAGDELTTAEAGDNQYTGTLVNVQADAIEGYEALAVIQISALEQGDLRMKDSDARITLLDLPYSQEAE